MEFGPLPSLSFRNSDCPSQNHDQCASFPFLFLGRRVDNLPAFGFHSCSVLVDGVETRSCITPVASVAGKAVTTLEGLPALYAEQNKLPQAPALHPLQQAFIEEQAAHCGYCYNGMTIKASELLAQNPRPSEAEIRTHMNGHLCRCGTYGRVMKAIQLASARMTGDSR